MSRVLLIHNPYAARTHAPAVSTIERVFVRAGWTVETEATSGPGDAVVLAQKGVEHAVDVVAVYGGDGTTIQAVGGLGDSGIPVGLIPGGTGNLLAANLGISRNPVEAARVITEGAPRAIDLGKLTSAGVSRRFAVACGAGFDAVIMAKTTGVSKSRWGMTAYVTKAIALLQKSEMANHRITVDGSTIEIEAATVLVANCGLIIPPYLRLKRDIRPDDGWLDVVALRAEDLPEAVAVVWQLLRGNAGNGKRVRYGRGRCITLESDRPRPAQLDGEPAGSTPFAVEVVPAGMNVIVPKIA